MQSVRAEKVKEKYTSAVREGRKDKGKTHGCSR